MSKIPLSELNSELLNKDFVLFLGLGFDQRSLCAIQNINPSTPKKIIGLLNPPRVGTPQTNYGEAFISSAGPNSEILGADSKSLIETIDLIQEKLEEPGIRGKEIVVDITSLSHEMLVAFMGLLQSKNLLKGTTLLYTGADEYSFNTSKDQKWLSRGVVDIRSILGFPGTMLPSKKLHLIIMVGFETERSTEVINRYEPSRLTIAYGAKDHSVSEEHHLTNLGFAQNILNNFLENPRSIDSPHNLEFSCTDPFFTKSSLESYISQFPNENIVICPLNTKISTVGAALAALEMPDIQICYAQPAEYNILGYASPGKEITIIKL
ncbi:hypothetical protein N8H74_11720 [Pseudomonas sp. B2M1-30]|uniref:hypothetical protein n=1 Tax=Pseudomonas TaxID=286 RepID=UPI0021C9825A|nr:MULTISPECIES: hypothetical protein [Pseudomonas]MCU0118925.1 hypothetical protein [Pseudomonas sp. B2M1-30]MCU7263407.1 hypothetical protein [Pseudomonas koreensis]